MRQPLQKHFLRTTTHPVAQKIVRLREFNKANTTFIETILEHSHNGRIHCDFHPLRSDEGGTVTGRFSSSNPNLQQIPARDPEIKEDDPGSLHTRGWTEVGQLRLRIAGATVAGTLLRHADRIRHP